ncbi:MAG: pyrroline-5-carboxylate reductase [Oscillospiraceae bacterium]|jgi:pyrroline-5-carboxylate reductase|nr:pyrroline-5-carboxylate reductase [Oscillospiraceae bacterium]
MKMGFIGVGVMASAMLRAALDKGFLRPADVLLYDKYPGAMDAFRGMGVAAAQSAGELARACDVIQLGVKPQQMPALLDEIQGDIASGALVISIAAGVPLQTIAARAPKAVRTMQNINAAVGESITAYCATSALAPEELAFVKEYCGCFGRAIALEESRFSAFLALAGSAPAFVYLFIDELARAGVSMGLPKALALEIAAQTTLGSAALVRQSDRHPYELVDNVCSPGGTTIAGINKLRELGFAHAVSQAALAAYQRDIQLKEER